MTIIFLDSDFAPLSAPIDDFRSLVWTRNYFEHDKYTVILNGKYYDSVKYARYMWAVDTGRIGIVTGVQYKDERGHQELTVTGYGAEALLDLRTTLNAEYITGNAETALRNLIIKHALTGDRTLPSIVLDAPVGYEYTVSKQVTGKPLSEVLYETLMPLGLSYYMRFDPDDKTLHLGIWSGKDRTQSQTENTFAVFSSSFGNLLTTDYTYDKQDYYNFAYVAGEGEGAERTVVTVDQVPEDEDRREIFIDARDLQRNYTDEQGNTKTLTTAEYHEVLRQRGIERLAQYNIKQSVEAEVDVSVLRYGIDFDLGDICEIANSDIGLTWTARITSIDEVFETEKMYVVPMFGERINFIDILKREVQK